MSVIRRPISIAIVCILFLLLVGDVIPRVILLHMRKLEPGSGMVAVTKQADATINGQRVPLVLRTDVTTEPARDDDNVIATTVVTALSGAKELGHISETVELVRESTFPETREGLNPFFPYTTERRSYMWYDLVRENASPVDYVETIDEDTDMPALVFHQHREAGEVGTQMAEKLGPHHYYEVDRTLTVEPHSGTVLDLAEELHIYRADNLPAARDNQREEVFSYSSSWDDATLARQHEAAWPVIRMQHLLAIVSWIAKALIVVVVVVYFWRRYRC